MSNMSNIIMRHRGLLATALGAGIFIGATGFFLLLKVFQERKKKVLSQNLGNVDLSVTDSQELPVLKKTVLSSSRLSLRSNSSRSSRLRRNGIDTDDEMFSALGSETEEFYDISSDEEDFFSFSSKSFTDQKSSASDENVLNLLEEVDILLKGNDEDRENALKLLYQEESQYSENPCFLWRLAKACQMQATAWEAKNDKNKKKEYVLQGMEYAGKALAIDPSNPDAHKWYAILTGMQGEFLSVKEKIQNGYKFEKHLKHALDSKPNDPSLYHLLGRFKYEIANLSWIEKKVAASLFAALPDVTIQDALIDFKKAEDLNPVPWKENRLFLAKCYIDSGSYEEAVEWLNFTKEINPQTKEDKVCDEECDLLLSKYKKYANRTRNTFS